MNTVAIIQARMDSTRLPGKVLTNIAGKPILWHIIHRLKRCTQVEKIVVATTTKISDEAIVNFSDENNIPAVRGSENDVLDRFLLAAREHDADLILRVCGDSPLIDPETIDQCLITIKQNNADIWQPEPSGTETIHEGFTPISRHALESLAQFGAHDPAVKEHVTAKVKNYVKNLKSVKFEFNEKHFITGSRTSVDTPADIEFINTLYQKLCAEAGDINITEVVSLLKSEPELLKINAHVHQKSIEELTHNIIIRCDGGHAIGLGHVMRCLSLATALRDTYSVGIRFAIIESAIAQDRAAAELINTYQFPTDLIPNNAKEEDVISALIQQRKPNGIIFDIRTSLTPDSILKWRKRGIAIICIDDPSDRRLACDMAFFPPVPQITEMSWSHFTGTLHVGWDWVLLGPSFSVPTCPSSNNTIPKLLIMMGGSDTAGITLKAIESLAQVKSKLEPHIILGRAFQLINEVKQLAQDLQLEVDFHTDVKNIAELMAEMDLAIATYGVTAYELAAKGVPSILLCLTHAHAYSAHVLHDREIAYSLGFYKDVSVSMLAKQIDEFLINYTRRKCMAKNALSLNITNGALNIAGKIKEALKDISMN